MFRSLDNLLGYQIAATNGTVGTVADFLFLDDSWRVRYLVVAAGGWLDRREVLVSTEAVRVVADAKREIRVGMTREMVQCSPDIDTDKPVTRQNEILLAKYYDWKPTWSPDPFLGANLENQRLEVPGPLEGCNPHLRSFREVTTYRSQVNEQSGLVSDLIANDLDWGVTGVVVTTQSRRRAELLPASRVEKFDWTNRLLRIADGEPGTRFDPGAAVNPRRVEEHYDYYGHFHHAVILPETGERN